jgi:hypothetical protein
MKWSATAVNSPRVTTPRSPLVDRSLPPSLPPSLSPSLFPSFPHSFPHSLTHHSPSLIASPLLLHPSQPTSPLLKSKFLFQDLQVYLMYWPRLHDAGGGRTLIFGGQAGKCLVRLDLHHRAARTHSGFGIVILPNTASAAASTSVRHFAFFSIVRF